MSDSKGVWIDSRTGKVVTTQPEEGVQLHAPGTEMTPDVEAAIKAAKAAEPDAPAKRNVEKAVTSKVEKATT
jgi:hypothetical protein